MANKNEIYDGVSVIRCPNCQEYIGIEAEECRYCSTQITDEICAQAVQAEKAENSQFRAAGYRNQIGGGALAAVGGAVLMLLTAPYDFDGRGVPFVKEFIFGIIIFFGGALVAFGYTYFWLQEKRGRG